MKTKTLSSFLFFCLAIQVNAQIKTDSVNIKSYHSLYLTPFQLFNHTIRLDYELTLHNKHGFIIGGSNYNGETSADYSLDDRYQNLIDKFSGYGYNLEYKYYFNNYTSNQAQGRFYGYLNFSMDRINFRVPAYLKQEYYDSDYDITLVRESYKHNALLILKRYNFSFGAGVIISDGKHIVCDLQFGYLNRSINYEGEAIDKRLYKRHFLDWGYDNINVQTKIRIGFKL